MQNRRYMKLWNDWYIYQEISMSKFGSQKICNKLVYLNGILIKIQSSSLVKKNIIDLAI